jgi:hypothetical protein
MCDLTFHLLQFVLNCIYGAFVGSFTCWGCVFVKITVINHLNYQIFKNLLKYLLQDQDY